MTRPGNTFSPGYIVGVGASAGGLEAINDLFDNIPSDTGFAFVIVQHISPDHKSLMAELVAKHTSMTVLEAEDNMFVKRDHIYVIPSRKFMTVRFGKLHLTEKLNGKIPNNAIDVFFDSLAADAGEHAIGIILSGTGTDGTKGIDAIKRAGGIVVVQDPVTAAFDGMPSSALSANVTDLIAAPDQIGKELIDLLNDTPEIKAINATNHKDEYLLRDLLALIRNGNGIDFNFYKRPTICRRLAKRMSELNIRKIADYLDYISGNEQELQNITKEFLINVSSFFRDKEAFEVIYNTVLPELLRGKTKENGIKVWTVACSTGEETYSLAMQLNEHLEINDLTDIPVKIFATDIDRDALEHASRGVYSAADMQDVDQKFVDKYFIQEGNNYRIHPVIRKMIVFSAHDILKDPPYSKVDLISCRNMLIYINPQHQKEIQRKLHFSMNEGGYLFLGSSENIGNLKHVTEEVSRKWKIYKCVSKARIQGFEAGYFPFDKRIIRTPPQQPKNPLQHIPDLFVETILEANHFAGVFITKEYEVKQAVGRYHEFLKFPEGNFNLNILKMVSPELSIPLNVAINKAQRENQVVVSNGIRYDKHHPEHRVDVVVKPYLQEKDGVLPFMFITFRHVETHQDSPQQEVHTGDHGPDMRILELEQELAETRTGMQLLLEEMETSNEELRSLNEEAVSSNEELQSTNEELQSLNEEMHTVSAEHQLKIKELIELNDDLNNYFGNSEIGQILIDRNLIIRKFTPFASNMINLIDSDIGRSITDITTKIRHLNIVDDIERVIRSGKKFEKEIIHNDNVYYLMRINPYLRVDKVIDGVVVNFIDITEVKRLNSIVQAVFNSSSNCINAKRAIRDENNEIVDFEYIAANKACELLYEREPGTLVGGTMKSMPNFMPDQFNLLRKVVLTGEPVHFEFFNNHLNKWLEVSASRMMDGVVSTIVDVTERKNATDLIARNLLDLKEATANLQSTNKQLEQSNLDLMQFASVASHDLKEPLRKIETFGNLLNTKLREKMKGEDLTYLDKIIKAARRMQVLIEDVLTFSKLSNSDIPFAKINLNSIVSRIIDDLEISIQDKNARIHLENLPDVRAVKGQMHQLFQNLISNALKFNESEYPEVRIKEIPVSRRIADELDIDPADYVCISVKDNGIGFDEQFRDKIFRIFQRLNGNNYEGTGIGLAICKKIVENNKGFLHVESEPGKGTEFMIVLPAISSVQPAEQQRAV